MKQEPNIFMMIGELLYQRGYRSIKSKPGLTELAIDEHWHVKVNPHEEELDLVPPCQILIEFNGFPAGIVGYDGGILAAGSAANIDEFIKAIRDRLADDP